MGSHSLNLSTNIKILAFLSALSSCSRRSKVLLSSTFPVNPAVHAPDLHKSLSKMKSITILPFIAMGICPALCQPRAAAIDGIPDSAPLDSRSNLVPYACSQSNILVSEQIAEIEQLQSKELPIPPDLAGYVFAVVNGRRMVGCPSSDLISPNGTSSSESSRSERRSSEPADTDGRGPGWNDPCEAERILVKQVTDQMNVLKEYNIPIPAYLAGWWSLTQDAAKILKDGGGCDSDLGNTASALSG